MKKHLTCDSNSILDLDHPFYKIGNIEYIKRRIQFWKWRKHRTMGRPVLLLSKPPISADKETKFNFTKEQLKHAAELSIRDQEITMLKAQIKQLKNKAKNEPN